MGKWTRAFLFQIGKIIPFATNAIVDCEVESILDFLIKLDMKPCTYTSGGNKHLSLILVIVRLTKIMNRADKNLAQF